MSPNTKLAVALAVSAMAAVGLTTPTSAQAAPPACTGPEAVLWGDYCLVNQQPLQGPTVTPNPGLAGVTFQVSDRSGVASQCTYSSEGFETSFGLPAKGSHDLFVPAVRLFKNRTGNITCDNGTSTPTSVFY